ncbi:DUF4142 domain-containing protein [Chondromyces apiculatus]|nr:DUF4142 domain-containing protein [Chondromyces apiculatus]
MRPLWMLAVLALLAGCDPGNQGEAVAAERSEAVAPGQGQPGGVMVPGGVMDTEAGATDRLMAAIATATQTDVAKAYLAIARSPSPDVRAFAWTLIDHQRRALTKIAELSREKKLGVQSVGHEDAQVRALAETGDEEIKRFRGLSGRSFDEAYLTNQLSTAVLIERYGVEGQRVSRDPDLDNFFSDIMAQAQLHRESAQQIFPLACRGMQNIPMVQLRPDGETPSAPPQEAIPAVASPDPAIRSAQPGGGSSMQIGTGQSGRDEKGGLENNQRQPYP